MSSTVEVCEYCDSKNATAHCCDCGKALCSLCQNEDENKRVKCLSCGDLPEVPFLESDNYNDDDLVDGF